MNRIHAVAIALVLAFAAIVGVVAATRSAGLGAQAQAASDTAIAQRSQRLDRLDAALRKALRDRPPAVPAATAGRAPQAQQVVYRRPAPLVVLRHASGGEAEHEDGHEAGHGEPEGHDD